MSVVRVDENVDTLDFASCIQHKLSVNKDVLNQHECTLIDHLGGLDVVMCLCLSNPELKKYVNKESFHCLTTLLKWNGIIDDDNTCNNMQFFNSTPNTSLPSVQENVILLHKQPTGAFVNSDTNCLNVDNDNDYNIHKPTIQRRYNFFKFA